MMQRIQRLRIDAVRAARRRRTDDAPDAGHLGRTDAHDGGRDQRILAARDVAADATDRDQLLPEHDARLRLGFESLHAVLLPLGELGHLLMAEREVLLEGLRQQLGLRLDLGRGNAELALPLVEVAREFSDRRVAILADLGEHAPHRVFHLGLAHLRAAGRLLQILACHVRFLLQQNTWGLLRP